MAIEIPGGSALSGDLGRVKSQEPNEEWPTFLEVVAYYGKDRKGKRKSITISADQFFGRGLYNAPMGLDQFLLIVERLRRSPP